MRQNKRGSVTIMSDTYLIRLFDGADMSTLIHETGHIFFEEMSRLVETGLADDSMRADYQIMRGWLGAKDGEALTVEQREKAARGFEAYLMEGRAPTREMKSAFSRFKKWLLAVYRRAVNLNATLTDEARGVFDRMLTADTVNRAAVIGKSLGLPMPVVANTLERSREEELARRIEGNPLLAGWVGKDEYRAAIATGDTDKVVSLFEGLQKESEQRKARRDDLGVLRRTGILLEEGIQDVFNGMEASITGAARFFSRAEFQDAEGNAQTAESAALKNWADTMDRQRDAFIKAQPPRLEAQTTLGGYLQDVDRMAPQIASQIAATLTTGPWGGMAVMGSQIAGGQYDRLRREGIDTDRAFRAGVMNALLQTPLEQLGTGKLLDIFKATGLKNIAKRTIQGTTTEALTEFTQAYPESGTDIWARLGENEGTKEWFERFKAALPETTKQGLYEGLVAAPFGVFGGIGRAIHENAWHKYVENFQERQIDLHGRVDELRAAGMAEELIRSALDHGGMGVEVGIDAARLVELQQSGLDIFGALGLAAEDVAIAASAGQDITMPLSQIHARLRREDFAQIAPHIRPAVQGPTAMEAAESQVTALDALELAELHQDNVALFKEMDAELQRIHSEISDAIFRNPKLLDKLRGQNQSVDGYARRMADLYEKYALKLARHGRDPIEFLRSVTIGNEIYARQRELRSAHEQANAEQNLPPFPERPDDFFENPEAGFPPLDGENAPVDEQAAIEEQAAIDEQAAGQPVDLTYSNWQSDFEGADDGSGFEWRDGGNNGDLIGHDNKSEIAINDDNYLNFWSNRLGAQQKLAEEISAWNSSIDEIAKAGRAPSNPVKMLGQTPLVLELVGRDINTGAIPGSGGIYASPHMLDGHHLKITPDVLKKIPKVIVDPIAIFDSATIPGALVFMVEAKDAKGNTVVVPLSMEPRSKDLKAIDANIVTSAYGKNNNGGIDGKWFREQLEKNTRYVNEEKIKRWQFDAGVQFPIVTYTNASGNKIFTFGDLVNFEREKNSPLYQSVQQSPVSDERFVEGPEMDEVAEDWPDDTENGFEWNETADHEVIEEKGSDWEAYDLGAELERMQRELADNGNEGVIEEELFQDGIWVTIQSGWSWARIRQKLCCGSRQRGCFEWQYKRERYVSLPFANRTLLSQSILHQTVSGSSRSLWF